METFEAVRTLLAVREYRSEPVPDAVVRRIVEAGRLTASARNRQPWRFLVVREPGRLRRLGELASRGPYIGSAPLCLIVAVETSEVAARDGARAIQAMMLTAWEAGVGSNWVSLLPEEEAQLRPEIAMPENFRVVALVPFGYPAGRLGRGRKQRRPLREIAFRERFGEPFEGGASAV